MILIMLYNKTVFSASLAENTYENIINTQKRSLTDIRTADQISGIYCFYF